MAVPELPDITVYVERLKVLTSSQPLLALTLRSPFLLRTAEPPPETFVGKTLRDVLRIGKRIAMEFEGELFAVIHLMIAGRLRWAPEPRGPRSGGPAIATFRFPTGSILMTEAGTKHRASLHLVHGRKALEAFDRGGVSVFDDPPLAFVCAMRRENRTLKRALTDPTIVDGIGNAYSDEILHRARQSPFSLTRSLDDAALAALRGAAREVLNLWTDRLRAEAGPTLPDKVTAFRPDMAVHGKFGKPCPVCGTPIQRVVYAENEANYCPTCQTGGRVLADRSLSRLLKSDWPRTIDELEKLRPV